MVGLHKATLLLHLHNAPLVQALRQKRDVDETRRALGSALKVLEDAGISAAAQMEVNAKIQEYGIVSQNYGNMIEDTWQITWQMASIIIKYLDCAEADLPEFARF